MNLFFPILAIIGWFIAIFSISYLINWLLARSIIHRHYRLFVAPGVIVHELSHAVGCLVTGSQIVEINFWKASGGHVLHRPSTDPFKRIISDPIIALAPIWGTFILLAILTWLLVPQLFDIAFNSDLTSGLRSLNWLSWQPWLYLYLVTSLVATIAPSKTDMRYALASLIGLAILLGFIFLIPGVAEAFLSWVSILLPFALFTLGLLVIGLIIAFLLALPMRHRHFAAKNQID